MEESALQLDQRVRKSTSEIPWDSFVTGLAVVVVPMLLTIFVLAVAFRYPVAAADRDGEAHEGAEANLEELEDTDAANRGGTATNSAEESTGERDLRE